jgi:hypothetical protein
MAMNTLTINQKMFISALVGFIIGSTAVWVWSVAPTQKVAQESEEGEESGVEVVREGDEESAFGSQGSAAVTATKTPVAPITVTGTLPTVTVVNQEAGALVEFLVTFNDAGWVVVHDDKSGALGNVLGAQWLPAGSHRGEVTLLRATEAGKKYHIVLYADDGDKQFELHGEAKLVVENGSPIQAIFVAQ